MSDATAAILRKCLLFKGLDEPLLTLLAGEAVTTADPSLHLPTAQAVWRVGRRLARAGQFTPPNRLLPIYTRPPKAVRLWNDGRRPGR